MTESNWNKKVSYPETTKIFSPAISDGADHAIIHKDFCLPIIQTVESQNIALKTQITRIQQEINNLEGMTKNLTFENESLRCHYSQRNRDIQNMIQAIKINLGVQLSDINHQIHLLREGNCLIFKNIQSQLKKQKQTSERVQQLTKNLVALKQETVEREQNILFPSQVRLKNKLNNKTLQKLNQERDKKSNNLQTLTKEINNLVMEVNRLQKQNLTNLRQEREEKQQIGKEKQNFKGNIINTLKSLNELKSDIELESISLRQINEQKEVLTEKYKKLQGQTKRKTIQQEKKMSKLTQVISLREAQLINFDETRKKTSELQIQLMKKKEEKENLRASLISKQSSMKKHLSDHQLAKSKIEDQKCIALFKLRMQRETTQMEKKKQEKELENQMKGEQKNIKDLKSELTQLKSDIKNYKQLFSQIQNPIKELEKEQFKQKLNQPKKSALLKSRW